MKVLAVIDDEDNLFEKFINENNYIKIDINEFLNNIKVCENIDSKIHKMIYKLGICASFKGYNYIVDAIKIVKEKGSIKITKDIYEFLASKYNTKASNIEGAIRNAIERGFDKAALKSIEEIFGNTICFKKGKPTNFEFIITLSKNIC